MCALLEASGQEMIDACAVKTKPAKTRSPKCVHVRVRVRGRAHARAERLRARARARRK